MKSDSPASVSSRLLRQLVDMARGGGLPIMPLLSLAGLSRELLAGPEQRLPLPSLERLVRAAVELSGDALLGLHLAQRAAAGHAGNVEGHASLRHLIDAVMARQEALADLGQALLLPRDEAVLWCWRGPESDAGGRRQIAEFLLAWCHITVLRPWRPAPLLAVHLQQEAPGDAEQLRAYERLFACPVAFGQAEFGLLLRASLLDLPFNAPAGVPALAPVVPPNPAVVVARDQLRTLLAQGRASREVLAEMLGLSGRQLQRQLEGAGSSYRQLLDELRLEQARALLADPRLSLEVIAERLHFSESQSFNRWFRALTAITPAEFRRQQGRG